ncbi:RHS repeat-associated core domain-containing protein [Psychrobacter sp. FDAARGOS_221]|nr:RHS repeat-associated core domain-containing protein [Psychrobacter sp. FDAARGOS_221]
MSSISVSVDELQPLRFQGQFIDRETGLHYNRFRYYVRSVNKRSGRPF